jgi:hypothetical protein
MSTKPQIPPTTKIKFHFVHFTYLLDPAPQSARH